VKETKPLGSYKRATIRTHDITVDSIASEARFKAWAKSFGAAVAKVLSCVDQEGYNCDPARECYCRFGWWSGMPATYILGWWMWSLKHFQEQSDQAATEVYEKAIRAIKKAL
jgi:hypothetical protein